MQSEVVKRITDYCHPEVERRAAPAGTGPGSQRADGVRASRDSAGERRSPEIIQLKANVGQLNGLRHQVLSDR
jgi:hypothetical protein